MFTFSRRSIDLNGTWKFCPDPMLRCQGQRWWESPSRTDHPFPCWDPEGLWEIQVPGTWKTQFNELKWYDGHAVYMRDFDVPEIPAGHEAFLVFDGVVYTAKVYLNGQILKRHDWGYSPFTVRVTESLRAKNRLFVRVENHHKPDRLPGLTYDWNNDGGIINPVKLIFVPITHIGNFRVQTRLEGNNVSLDFEIFLRSRDNYASENVTVRIPELGLESSVISKVGTKALLSFKLPHTKIDLWCPENPKLYQVELSTRYEVLRDELGFREVRTLGKDILLNGNPIRLYGLCVHSDFKETGRTATAKGIGEMISKVRALGVNFLRCAHYPYAEAWGRALDRAGLLWWEEVPAYWLSDTIASEGQTRLACGMMEETIRRDWNRASLIFWSVSNECMGTNRDDPEDNNYKYWFTIVPKIRQMDPSRLISCADAGYMFSVKPVWAPGQHDNFVRPIEDAESWRPGHPDSAYELFDVLSGNLYANSPGESAPLYHRFVEMFRNYNKPLMISEFGSMSLRGTQVQDDVFGSEVRHEKIIREAYAAFRELPEISGWCIWCLADIRVPIHWRWYNSGKGVFRYGLIDEEWQEKRVFNVVREEIGLLKKQFKSQQALQ